MLSVSVSIDVPDMSKGIRFYADAFGFSKVAEPYPGVAVLEAGQLTITLLEKREQTPVTKDPGCAALSASLDPGASGHPR
jgi:hypothetical protein